MNDEIYILTKHGKFQAEYVEELPIYRRRYFLHLMQKENEEIEKQQEAARRR
jgi:hypothetical protein